MKNIFYFLLLLFAVWLVACSAPSATPTPMPTILATDTVSEAQPSHTPTQFATLTPQKPTESATSTPQKPTQSATSTLPEPTQAATSTLPEPTQSATSTPSATPEPSATIGLIEVGQLVPSPDGQWVAIVNKEAGSLALQGPDGEKWPIFGPGSTIFEVSWSPNSRDLLVVRTNWPEAGGEFDLAELWKVQMGAGLTPTLLFKPEESEMNGPGSRACRRTQIDFGKWSPDGRYVLFWYALRSASLQADGWPPKLLDVETGEITHLSDSVLYHPRYHSWAPDSSALVMTAGGGRSAQINKWLTIIDMPSGENRCKNIEKCRAPLIPGIVDWSAKGDLIAFAAVAEADTSEELADWMVFENPAIAARRIYLLDPVTGEYRRLNDEETFQDAPTFSADGSTLYYVQHQDDTVMLMAADLYTQEGEIEAQIEAQIVEGSQQPAPAIVGYYGQGEWEALLAHITSAPQTPTPTATPVIAPALATATPRVLVNGAHIVSLAVDPHDAQTIIALQTPRLLIKSQDGGQTWVPLPLFPTPAYQQPHPPFILPQQAVRAVPNRAGRFFVEGLWRTDDGGSSWQALQEKVQAWTMHRPEPVEGADATGDLLYTWRPSLSREQHGLYRTQDGGATWRHVYRGFFPPRYQYELFPPNHEGITALVAAEPTVLYAGTDYGIFRSVDGGQLWEEFNAGLPPNKRAYRWTPVLIAASDGTIFALTEHSPDNLSVRRIIARLRPGEESWTPVGEQALADFQLYNPDFAAFNTLVADPIDPNRLYLGTDFGLLVSGDGGENWLIALEGTPVHRLAVAPSQPSQLYLWTDEGFMAHNTSAPPQ